MDDLESLTEVMFRSNKGYVPFKSYTLCAATRRFLLESI